jgi:CheY-like chemotaxis protein/anti-sigma regulatory factor (Ser/Thr protein kinase)
MDSSLADHLSADAPVLPDEQSGAGIATVVVVDDSPIDRRLAERLLTRATRVRIIPAENGVEALRKIEEQNPDLVLTDLRMPVMDGLELVEAIRSQFPLVPTILMTANGSEEIAIQALRQGAAGYVAKRRLSLDLVETVQNVLALSRQDRQQLRLRECWMKTHFEFCLGNDSTLVPVLVLHLQQFLRSVRHCDETELVRVSVALSEALQNAMLHGNLELDSSLREEGHDAFYREAERRRACQPYAGRKVLLTAFESPEEARYVVRDEGSGFDVGRVLQLGPTDPEHLTRLSGRGLFLIRTFMSEVHFNSSGNEITMIHRREPAADLRGADGRHTTQQPSSKRMAPR